MKTRKVTFASRPQNQPDASTFAVVEETLPQLQPGQVLVRVDHLSIDAWISTMLGAGSLHGALPIGGTLPALGVGTVLRSQDPSLQQGDAVFGPLGAQSHVVYPAGMLRALDTSEIPARAHCGVLGLTTGLTAWVGLNTIGGLKSSDTVVVSAAAGATGSVACEIARLRGGRVIGIAGGPDKMDYLLNQLGIAAAIDYRSEDVAARIKALAPQGVNLFFDNVGGTILDAVLDNLAMEARVVICGAISQYPRLDQVTGPSRYLKVAERNASMRGFTVDYWSAAHADAVAEISAWQKAGQFRLREEVLQGIDRFPEAMLKLYSGHIGKLMVAP
ncbi:MAG: NADP-dependent oxidoreductase [Gammaproteobacteria bacterium]|nr:NADP-dependent oxidoreductase [Gammaproteobacteria bacterium]